MGIEKMFEEGVEKRDAVDSIREEIRSRIDEAAKVAVNEKYTQLDEWSGAGVAKVTLTGAMTSAFAALGMVTGQGPMEVIAFGPVFGAISRMISNELVDSFVLESLRSTLIERDNVLKSTLKSKGIVAQSVEIQQARRKIQRLTEKAASQAKAAERQIGPISNNPAFVEKDSEIFKAIKEGRVSDAMADRSIQMIVQQMDESVIEELSELEGLSESDLNEAFDVTASRVGGRHGTDDFQINRMSDLKKLAKSRQYDYFMVTKKNGEEIEFSVDPQGNLVEM